MTLKYVDSNLSSVARHVCVKTVQYTVDVTTMVGMEEEEELARAPEMVDLGGLLSNPFKN